MVVMLNGRVTKPGLLRPRQVGGLSAMWLHSAAVGTYLSSLHHSQDSSCRAVLHCRQCSQQYPVVDQFLTSHSGIKEEAVAGAYEDRSGAITFGVFSQG